VLASNASSAEQQQNSIDNFVGAQTIFLSQLLASVILNVTTPAAAIAEVPFLRSEKNEVTENYDILSRRP
jgi:hypothetical protein